MRDGKIFLFHYFYGRYKECLELWVLDLVLKTRFHMFRCKAIRGFMGYLPGSLEFSLKKVMQITENERSMARGSDSKQLNEDLLNSNKMNYFLSFLSR